MDTLMEYKCPCCGGMVEFDSASQKMKCPYCDTEFDMEALQQEEEAEKLEREQPEQTPEWKIPGQEWSEEESECLRTYQCQSCGGELITDENTAATQCPYCGNPVILTGRLSGGLRPDYVLPFKLDKKAAKEALSRHMSGKKLLPKLFREESRLEEIKGVYVPFWLFDASAAADGRYAATRTRVWSDSDYNYTETSHYAVARSGSMKFAAVPVDGASKIPNDLMESVEPFDVQEAKPFSTGYLSGFLADRYDVSAEESEQRANQRIRETIAQALEDSVVGYDSLRTTNLNVHLEQAEAVYALMPVWLMTAAYEGQTYLYAMNGQTGKIAGNMPVDRAAVRKWHAIWSAAIGGGLWALWLVIRAFL